MSTENGMPVVEPFDFSQDKWQADIKHLDAAKRALFLKALELEFPDLRWNDESELSSFIPAESYIECEFFDKKIITYYDLMLFGVPQATQAQVTLFISEYMDKVAEFEGDTVPSLHVPGAKDVRSHNVGSSDYAAHKIQPWDIWLEYGLNPWEADIVKRTLRTKEGQSRREDFEKVIHIAQECIRQIDAGEYRR